MYAFTYHRPQTVRQAANMLAKNADAKLLAGGQTLLPTMKLRLAGPPQILDMWAIEGLVRHRAERPLADYRCHDEALRGQHLAGGAAGRSGARQDGRPDRRSGGAPHGHDRRLVANNDPNADYPAACLALGATIITNKRRIKADDFFTGMFSTALEPNEIITKVSFPLPKKAAYQKFRNQASRFALVGVFVAKRGSEIGVAVTGAGSNGVFRVKSFEEALKKRFSPKSLEGMTIPADGMNADIHGSAEYRAHLVGVLARRAVAEAIGKSAA